jgi:hypothetical protein
MPSPLPTSQNAVNAKFTDVSPRPRGRGVSGCRCRDRHCVGRRRLRQRDCVLTYASSSTERRPCFLSRSSEVLEEAVLLLPPRSGSPQNGTTLGLIYLRGDRGRRRGKGGLLAPTTWACGNPQVPAVETSEVEATNEGRTGSSVQASVAGPSQRKACRNSLAPSSSYGRPWAMITFSGSQASMRARQPRATRLRPQKVILRSKGVLPSGSAAPASRTSHP